MRSAVFAALGGLSAVVAAGGGLPDAAPLPPVPFPPENPPTEAKRVLGKMLFFEEQLSVDDTVACATCHVMSRAGTDPRRGRNPGRNETLGDDGDVMGSPGVRAFTADGALRPAAHFGGRAQVTPRTAPSPFLAPFESALLWDGRAGGTFLEPTTGGLEVLRGGALESQALLPLTNPVEMGHETRTLPEILEKLGRVRPLALATRLPADLDAALVGEPGYGELFERAFGDPEITAARVAMAIATYERSLVPDRTDYDLFLAGDLDALNARERRGLQAFHDSGCATCHTPPFFTDGQFRNTGVRPSGDDLGRAEVTLDFGDRGKFKVPTLRNAALKQSFFHDGKRTSLREAIRFYDRFGGGAGSRPKPDDIHVIPLAGGTIASPDGLIGPPISSGDPSATDPGANTGAFLPPENQDDGTQPYGSEPDQVRFTDNLDPLMELVELDRQDILDIEAFLTGGLVDPRVQDETFPFDRPVLWSERLDARPVVHGRPSDPEIVIAGPAVAGSADFRVGLVGAPAGASARLAVWRPVPGGQAPEVQYSAPVPVTAVDPELPATASLNWSLEGVEPGTRLSFVWRISKASTQIGPYPIDPGEQTSRVAEVTVRAPRGVEELPADGIDDEQVDDGDAYVESALLRIDPAATVPGRRKDRLRLTARLNPRGLGRDLSHGRVSLRVGGTPVLLDAQLDASGRSRSGLLRAEFDPVTGELDLTLRSADLRDAAETLADDTGRGTTELPVEVTVAGLGLVEPTVTARQPFAWRGRPERRVKARFDFQRTGTGAGAFHVTEWTAEPAAESPGRTRVHARAVLDAPGDQGFAAPTGLSIQVGAALPHPVDRGALVPVAGGRRLAAENAGDVGSLEIDLRRRTVEFDMWIDTEALGDAVEGTVVPLPIVIRTNDAPDLPGVTYATVTEIVTR